MTGKKGRSGRKRLDPPANQRCVYLTEDQVKLVRQWGRGDVSAGLRWLIDQAKSVVRRPDTPPE